MRLLELPDVLREFDLEPVLLDGWRTRGREYPDRPEVGVMHHTAGSINGDYPSLKVVRDGRSDVPGPLANVGMGRHDPFKVYVFASGVSNNAGRGSWKGYAGNPNTVGCELEHTGYLAGPRAEGWVPAPMRYEAAVRIGAALTKLIDSKSPEMICLHKEWARNPDGTSRKIDPVGFVGNTFRNDIYLYLANNLPPAVPPKPPQKLLRPEDKMYLCTAASKVWLLTPHGFKVHLTQTADIERYKKAGVPDLGHVPNELWNSYKLGA